MSEKNMKAARRLARGTTCQRSVNHYLGNVQPEVAPVGVAAFARSNPNKLGIILALIVGIVCAVAVTFAK